MGDAPYWRTLEENAKAIVNANAPGGWRLVGFAVWHDGSATTVRSEWAWGDPADQHGMTVECEALREGDALDSVVEQLRRLDPLA